MDELPSEVATVMDRLAAAAETDDVGWFLSAEATTCAAALHARITPEGHGPMGVFYALGYLYWCQCVASNGTHPYAGGAAVFFLAPIYRLEPESVPEPLHPAFATLLDLPGGTETDATLAHDLGTDLMNLYHEHRYVTALPDAQKLLTHAVNTFPPADPGQGASLSTLGAILLYESELNPDPALLTFAVQCAEAAVTASPGTPQERVRRLGNLGFALTNQAGRTGDRETALRGVAVLRQARELVLPDDPMRVIVIANLGDALIRLVRSFDETAALGEGIELLRQAIAMTPAGTRAHAARLATLGTGLLSAAVTSGDFDPAIDAYRQAASMALPGTERVTALTNLAYAMYGRASRASDPAALDEAGAVVLRALEETPPGHQVRHQALFVLSEIRAARYEAAGAAADLEAAVESARESLELIAPDHDKWAERVVGLADLLFRKDRDDARAEAVQVLRHALPRTAPRTPERSRLTLALGWALNRLSGHAEESLRLLRECQDLPSPDRRFTAQARFRLGSVLARDATSWHEGVGLMRQGADLLPPGHPNRGDCLSTLANLYLERGKNTLDPELFDEGRRLVQEALADAAPGTGQYAMYQSNLGVTLASHGRNMADGELLAESVRAHRAAVAATPPTDRFRPVRLGNLGDSLRILAEHTSDTALLEEAVEVQREAVAAAHDDAHHRALCLTQLGSSLRTLSSLTAEPVDRLREAAGYLREAVAIERAAGRPVATQLIGLCNILLDLGGYTRDDAPYDEVVRSLTEELATAAHTPEERGLLLHTLGLGQWYRAAATGDAPLLEAGLSTLRQAVAVLPPRHLTRAGVLMSLGAALAEQSVSTADPAWLDEAVEVLRTALAESPERGHQRAMVLSNLTMVLGRLYEETGDRALADEALAYGRGAASTGFGDRRARSLALMNVAVVLQVTAADTGDPQAQAEVIAAFEEALAEMGEDHPRRAQCLSNLATAHWTRAQLTSDTSLHQLGIGLEEASGGEETRESLRQAAVAARTALTLTPESHPDRAAPELVLSRSQLTRALLGEQVDLAEAVRIARRAAESANASITVRLLAARAWGDAAARAGLETEALAGYAYGVELLPRVAPRGLSRVAQEERLGITFGLAGDAAAFALRAGEVERALSLLEQGRGVLLAQALETRGDLSPLRAADPGLADEFERLREAMGGDGGATTVPVPVDPSPEAEVRSRNAAVRLAEERRARAREWDLLVERIRALPGFESFLRPPETAELLASASEGPVVVVNVSRYRSDALLVTGDGIQVVELTGLSTLTAVQRAAEFIVTIDAAYGSLGPEAVPSATRSLTDTLEWVWSTVAEPVLDRLGLRSTPDEGMPWPRLFWCPTSWSSFLPLHAAGRHLDGSMATVLDRAVSSYTPTLRALIQARARLVGRTADEPSEELSPLVITLSETPGGGGLPGAAEEAALIRRIFPRAVELADSEASVEAVRALLPEHAWVHFGCHGVSDLDHPSEAGLQLYDGRLRALDASALRMERPVLAVLAACSTSQGGFFLPDEVIHVASSFQLAGYPHVIGTLWPVSDKLSRLVTEEFYSSLAQGGFAPAVALHRPIRALRDRFAGAPHLWAAHTHTGP